MTVGMALPRRNGRAKVAGSFMFLTDRTFSGCLWAAVIRSPYPRAQVMDIDTAALVRRAGVVAAYRASDLPQRRFNPATLPADCAVAASADKQLLTDLPRHVGDGVAVIVATSRAAARQAVQDPPVAWRPLPAVLTLDDARIVGATIGSMTLGDERADALISTSELIVEEQYDFSAASHVCLEPHACAALPEGSTGGVCLWTNSQSPAEVQRLVSVVLDWPLDRIRIRKNDEGGGFGARQEVYEEILLAWLAIELGRPVRLTYTRVEELTAGTVRGGGHLDVRLGFDETGKLLATDLTAVLDSGAYASHTPFVLSCLAGHVLSVYPNAVHHFRGTAMRTNTIPAGAYRGYGVAEANFAVEQALDVAAGRLGISPIEIRLRNIVRAADGGGLQACLRFIEQHSRAPITKVDGLHRGTGIAVAVKHSVTSVEVPDASTAVIEWRTGPVAALFTGTCDSGTGSSTALAQIVSSELGIPVGAIEVEEGDTAMGALDVGSTSQRSVFLGGQAASAAAARALEVLINAAADATGCRPEDLQLRWPDIVNLKSGAGVISVGQLIQRYPPRALTARIRAQALGHGASQSALRVSVAVDIDTGQVIVEDAVMAVDCGIVVNPLAARGQILGGVVQGIGLACMDRWDPGPAGKGPGGIFAHGVPVATDAPPITVAFCHSPLASAPSGLGELPIVPVVAAVANAVAAATGVRMRSAPLRPGDVWRQLRFLRQPSI